MNKCKICNKETKNKYYCSLKCRDKSRYDSTREIRYCLTCGKKITVYRKSKTEYCSLQCMANNKKLNKQKIIASKKTKLQKYGNENFINIKKRKETCLKKYGVDSFSKTASFLEKFKKTTYDKYGTEFPMQNETIKNKARQTVNTKYGGFTLQSDILKKQVFKTNIERYGVSVPTKNDKIKEKIKNTNLNKYGSEWASSNKKIIQKRIKTLKQKYGNNIDNISQVKSVSDKIKRTVYDKFYAKLISSNDFLSVITPLFSISEYIGSNHDLIYKFRCNICNGEFKDHLNNGHIPRCIKCHPIISGKSHEEKEILEYIKKILPNISIIENDTKILNGKELDIYIPSKKIAIEYDGLYWHSELKGKDKNYHLNKTNECKQREIRLIHIFEDEWLYKQNIVKNRLKYILTGIKPKLYARQCVIREISTKEKNDFLDEYHIQGKDKSFVKIGAFHENKLVAVMTFSKMRIALGSTFADGTYELSRFATSIKIHAIASKLLKFFIRSQHPNKIITYSDKRWNTGTLYEKLNFNKISDGTPGYWYIKNGKRMHRFNFRKSVLHKKLNKFDANLTEWQNMQLNGYDRIWDCGNLKYELKTSKNF